MSEAAVVDASPLIYLAHANLIDLLRVASPLILVPTTVSQEIRRRGANDPTVQAFENTPWLREVEPGPDSPVWSPGRLALERHPSCPGLWLTRDPWRSSMTWPVAVAPKLSRSLSLERWGSCSGPRPEEISLLQGLWWRGFARQGCTSPMQCSPGR